MRVIRRRIAAATSAAAESPPVARKEGKRARRWIKVDFAEVEARVFAKRPPPSCIADPVGPEWGDKWLVGDWETVPCCPPRAARCVPQIRLGLRAFEARPKGQAVLFPARTDRPGNRRTFARLVPVRARRTKMEVGLQLAEDRAAEAKGRSRRLLKKASPMSNYKLWFRCGIISHGIWSEAELERWGAEIVPGDVDASRIMEE